MAKKKNPGLRVGSNVVNYQNIPVGFNLASPDGTFIGSVSYDAYKAVQNGTLDEYTPKNYAEKDVIDKYKNHAGFELKTENGTSFGKVSYDGYNAIINDKLDTYNPKNDTEKKAIEDFKNYTGYGLTADKVNTQYNSNRYGKGNIDLKSRPMYENSDGSISTVRSISFNENGKEILIPTIIRDKNGNAKLLSDEEAIKHYHETGEYLGKFDSVNEANKYAMRLNIEQDLLYSSKYFVVADYVPSDNNMSRSEYNRRRASNPSMPEFGSYDYFKNREKVLRRYVDEISEDPDRQDDVIKAWAEGYANGTITKKHNHYELAKEYYEKFKYQDAIIEEYKDIDAQLKKFETAGVHYDNSGNIDAKSGASEAKYAKERYGAIAEVIANDITYDEMALAVTGELPAERQQVYDSIKVIQGQKNVEAAKETAYNYYAENKDNTYANDIWGRITGNYEIGYIGTKMNDAGFASYQATTDDLEAVEVYQNLLYRIQNRNKATFTNHGAVDETISALAQYAPQAIQQEGNKLVGKAIGAVVALSTGGGLNVRETSNFFGSAFVANYMYRQTAGAAFVRNLQENGLSVADAKLLATNEALASAAIEFGLDWATDNLWKGVGKATKGATTNAGEKVLKALTSAGISENGAKTIIKVAKNAGKVTIDALSEGGEEWIQEGISITADRYASEGKSASAFELLVNSFDLSKYSEDDFDRMNQSFLAGTIIGLGHGGLSAVTSLGANGIDKVISNTANAVDAKVLGEEIIASGETKIIADAVEMAKGSTDATILKAVETVETAISEGKTPPAKAVGTVVKGVLTDEAVQASATATVGDTFINTKSNNVIKILERTDTATKVEITTPDGKKEIKVVSNKQADQLIANETYKKVETSPVSKKENVATTGKKNINLKRVGKYYVAYGDEAVALAESLGVNTQKRNINGVETDVLLMPADLIEKAAQTMTDEFNFIFSDKPNATVSSISTESENALTTDENVATDETTTEVDFNVVVETINDTLVPEAKDGVLSGMNENGIDGGLVEFAKGLTRIYQKTGTLGGMEKFFTDKGKRVMSAMDGRTEAVSETETTTTPTEIEDTEVVESQTIPEMETADEVVAKNAIPTEVLKNEQKSDTIKENVVNGKQSVEVGDEFYFPEENKTYRVTAKTKGSTSFEVTSADGSVITKRMSNNFIDKYFTDDKRVNKSSAEETSVEREDNGNERRSGILHDDGKRNDNESARKRDGKLSEVRRQNSERNETERREFARELREQGQTEQVTVENNTFELVNPEAYNDDMLAMVEEAKNRGEELGFFVGEGTVTIEREDGTKRQKSIAGVKTRTGKIYVRYDADTAPQTLYKHEHCHKKWRSLSMQRIKDKILNGLTAVEKKAILSTQRYQDYMTAFMDHYKGDVNKATDAVWEEFVCDVMSGMNDYVTKYSDVVNEYWNENESVERYNPADYATETDAGGTKHSLSSMGAAFFGNEDISADEFYKKLEDGSYKEQPGYKKWFKDVVNVYAKSRGLKKLTDVNISGIEKQVEGIMKVAVASKKAGYDIYDDGVKRSKKDSKKRLLFSSLEPNSDYVTSSDVSSICDKAKNFTEIYDGIVKLEESRGVPADERFFSNVDNYFILHKLLADKGLTIPCDECYVQAMRKNLTPMANAFIELVTEEDANNKANGQLYHQDGKDKGNVKKNNAEIREKVRELCSQPDCPVKLEELTLQKLTTADGLTELRVEAPLLYETFNSFYGQSKPKMPRKATPFRPGELIAMFTNAKGEIKTSLVNKIKATGGFRLQSYGDFQIENFVDVLQTIFEASMLGLNGHAYTKVPAFLEATDGTNLKRNISIFMYEDNGEWRIDKKNSFPMELEDIYALVNSDESGNTGIIAVSQNESMSAWIMANDFVGYGIPFHKSGTRMDVVRGRVVKTPDGREILGYANQKDHTKQQTEVYKKTLSEKQKENTKVKKPIDIYKFWDFKNKDNLSKNELIEKNLKKYIDECNKNTYRPKFREYLMDNESVLNEVLADAKKMGFVSQDATVDDVSFKYDEYTIPYGYYKFLGDFGMFKPDGSAAPIETLSLENYDFDKAVDFFKDSGKLRTNELLQQFENGKVRDGYRKMVENGELTTEQLEDILREKRSEIVQSVVNGESKYSFAEDKNESGELNGYEQISNGKKLGQLENSSKVKGYNRVGEVGYSQPQKQNTSHTKVFTEAEFLPKQ